MLEGLADVHVVVLPDVYLDVTVPASGWADTCAGMDRIAGHGGGNLPVGPIDLKVGGNAANLALALARLGARVSLVADAAPRVLHMLQEASAGLDLDLDRVREVDVGATTVALECGDANVMLSHAGPVADFGPARLDRTDLRLLREADAVAVVNWAQNRQGTRLLETVAHHVEGTLFFDSADPRHAAERVPGLLASPALARVGIWGMNENEALAFAAAAGVPAADPLAAARGLVDRFGLRIDLHTARDAWTLRPSGTTRQAAPDVTPRRLTGAGDAWNAGDIAGELLGLADAERLDLAHRVAAAYVSSVDGRSPTRLELA